MTGRGFSHRQRKIARASRLLDLVLADVVVRARAVRVGVVVRVEPDAFLDREEALLLARGHARGPEDLVHLLERETLRLGHEEPDEHAAGEGERLARLSAQCP